MPDSETVLLKKGDSVVEVPPADVPKFTFKGYRRESAGEQEAREAKARFSERTSGIGSAISAGIGSFASGVTLGASDALLGGDAYMRRADAEDRAGHPYVSTTANIAGAVLPALVGDVPGLGGLAEYTPAKITSNIGAKIAGLGEGGGTIGKVAATAGAGAFEGAMQNAGGYISDVALGDRDLSAEGFLGAMGKGALYGGVAGGALSTASNGLMAARKLIPAAERTTEAAAAAETAATRAIRDSVDTSASLENTGRREVSRADFEQQQFIQDLEAERAQAMQHAEAARPAGEVRPPGDPRMLMKEWRAKYPEGAVDYNAATAAARRERLAQWAADFQPQNAEDEAIKAYFSTPQDPLRTAERIGGIGGTDVPGPVQKAARNAAADASHTAYLDATAQAANVAGSGTELMARATYAGRKAAASAMDDVYGAYRAGTPIADIQTATARKLSNELHELAEARADMIAAFKSSPVAGDLMAKLQGTKAALGAGQSLPSLGERILAGVPKAEDPDAVIARALGKSKDVNVDIATIAPKITRYEAAKAQLTESLGTKATPDAIEHAQGFRAAQEEAATKTATNTAQAADAIDKSLRGVPAEAMPGGKPLLRGLAKKAEKFAMLGEALHSFGLPALGLHSLPVIGPILSTFLKAKLLTKIVGNHSGSIAATAEGTIAAKAAETQNRICGAIDSMLGAAGKATEKAATHAGQPAAVLAHKLFDIDGTRAPYTSAPKAGPLAEDYAARLAELTAAQSPGAVEEAVRARITTHDPTIINAIVAAEQRKLTYLYNAAPKPSAHPLPGDPPWSPSRAEIANFETVLGAYHDPSAIFERVAAGGAAHALEVDCVANCYPQLYVVAQKHAVNALLKGKGARALSYRRRVAVSAVVGIPFDTTMTPGHAAYLQQTSKTVTAMPPTPHSALANPINVGARTLTRLDKE